MKEKTITQKYDFKIKIIIFIFIITSVVVVILGYNLGNRHYYWLTLLIPQLIIYFNLKNKRKWALISEEWGSKRKKKSYFKSIRQFFTYLQKDNDDKVIDDQTWSDLDMDVIYTDINRTYTTQGENMLYSLLKTPLYDPKSIEERNERIEFFQTNQRSREKILYELLKLQNEDYTGSADLLWGELPKKTKSRYFFTLMYLLSVLSILSIPFYKEKSLLAILAVFIINGLVYFSLKSSYVHIVPSVKYLSKIIKTADSIRKLKIKGFEHYSEKLAEQCKQTKPLYKKIKNLTPRLKFEILTLFFEYVNMYFLRELRGFYAASDKIKTSIVNLRGLYCTIGEIDALISIASYRTGLKNYSKPIFTENTGDLGFYLKVEDMFHPLLEDPVANSISFSKKGVMITGSNMAGKSTFLRTVGVNALLAQTLGICLAKKYKGCFFEIISSINIKDDLTGGKSFYFSESERLLKIIKTSQSSVFSLCIIDELLAGTNSFERLNASEEILKYLINQNALVVVATHDITLAENLKSIFECFHFVDHVDKKGMNFDYIIKEGISTTSNAIRLLEYLKYPEEIYTKAYQKAVE